MYQHRIVVPATAMTRWASDATSTDSKAVEAVLGSCRSAIVMIDCPRQSLRGAGTTAIPISTTRSKMAEL